MGLNESAAVSYYEQLQIQKIFDSEKAVGEGAWPSLQTLKTPWLTSITTTVSKLVERKQKT